MGLIKAESAFFKNRTRLNFVSGKGGVGKSSVSCALAWKARQLGLETLLLAVNPAQPIETFFGKDGIPSDSPAEIFPGLSVMNLDHLEIFDDFIRNSLKIRRIYEIVLSSHVYQYFAAIAPGIKELITQDVIASALERNRRFHQRYFDFIVVDSPATGHGLSWFSVPDAVLTTFLVGPLNKKAREIKALWQNKELTSIHLVTLPEEMPVNETLEFHRSLQNLDYPVSTIFLNGIFPKLKTNGIPAQQFETFLEASRDGLALQSGAGKESSISTVLPDIFQSTKFYLKRRELNETYRDQITTRVSLPVIEIPMFFQKESSLQLIEQIGALL